MKLFFPVVLAAAWIALVGMTLTDFAGFAAATRPCMTAMTQGAAGAALVSRDRHTGPHAARAQRACP